MPENYGNQTGSCCRWLLQLCCILIFLKPVHSAAQLKVLQSSSLPAHTQYPIPDGIAGILIEKARGYSIYTESELALRVACYQQAIPLFRMSGNRLRLAETLQILGDCYNHQGKVQAALSELTAALVIYKEEGVTALQGIYDLLGNVYVQQGDYKQAVKYGFMAVKTAEIERDTSLQLCTIYNRLGLTLFHLARYSQALAYFRKSLQVAVQCRDTAYILTVLPNVASAYEELGKYDEAIAVLNTGERNYAIKYDVDSVTFAAGLCRNFLALGKYGAARTYVKRLQALSKRFDADNNAQDVIYEAVLGYYRSTGNYRQLRQYALQYEAYCKRGGFRHELLADYEHLFRADSGLGNYAGALAYYQQYKLLQDSLFGEEQASEVDRLEAQHEIDRKDHELRLKEQRITLLTRRSMLQREELQKARMEGTFIIGGAVALVFVLILGYNRFRLKHEVHRQLHRQQVEIWEKHDSLHVLLNQQRKLIAQKDWLLEEIHCGVKDNLQFLIRLLSTQAASLDDEHVLAAIRESKHRMQAISLIHQRLHHSESVDMVEMDIYIRELVAYFNDSLTGLQEICFDLQITTVYLEVGQAVSVGLILNEAITNAIKYAFTPGKEGVITIGLNFIAENHLLLSLKDNGKGLPHDFEERRHESMGISLMETLSEQLEGCLSVRSKGGVSVSVIFKPQQHNRDTVPGLLNLVNKTA